MVLECALRAGHPTCMTLNYNSIMPSNYTYLAVPIYSYISIVVTQPMFGYEISHFSGRVQ